jgi:two-component system, NtrC family, sensor kinase
MVEILRLLVVDDEEPILDIFRSLFASRPDVRLHTATSAADGLLILAETPIDVIISDERMPGMQGSELMGLVRDQWPETIRILMTGYTDIGAAMTAVNLGKIFAFLSKPFSIPELKVQVDAALEQRRHRTEERQQTEFILQNVLASEKHYRAFFNESLDVIFVTTPWGQLLEVNQAGFQLFGFTGGAVPPEFNVFALYTDPTRREDFKRTVVHDGYVRNFPASLRIPSGQSLHVLVSATALYDNNKRIIAFRGTLRDISDRVREEEELKRINMELQEANRKLKQSQVRLIQQEKLASIGSLAAGVAHELNNPIGFIASNFSTLQQYLVTISDYMAAEHGSPAGSEPHPEGGNAAAGRMGTSEREKKIDFILHDIPDLLSESLEGIERITAIVQSLRQFSRVDYESKFELYDINQGLENTLVVARNEIKYVADVVREFGDIPPVECIAGEINQVFLNILVNAAQAIADQKRKEKGRIVVRTRVDGAWLVCEIEDDGPGIPAEIIGRVFDPFFTTKKAGRGTGLGLNISYDTVVSKHGGELTVASEVGRGTRFTVKLPMKRNPAPNPEGANDGI